MRRSEAWPKLVALAEALEDPERLSTDYAAILELDLAEGAAARACVEESVLLIRRLARRLAEAEGRGRDPLVVLREVARPTPLDEFGWALDETFGGISPD